MTLQYKTLQHTLLSIPEVLLAGVHGPSFLGFAMQFSFTGAATRRSEFPVNCVHHIHDYRYVYIYRFIRVICIYNTSYMHTCMYAFSFPLRARPHSGPSCLLNGYHILTCTYVPIHTYMGHAFMYTYKYV